MDESETPPRDFKGPEIAPSSAPCFTVELIVERISNLEHLALCLHL